jgi:hypothetical protein
MKNIIDQLLESEEYVPYNPGKHDKLHFQLARLVKDEIRTYKWIEGEMGNELTWPQAVAEWMVVHYKDYMAAISPKKSFAKKLWTRRKEGDQ